MIDKKCVMFQGISGCGKGTQASLLKQYLDKNTELQTFIMEAGHGFRSIMGKEEADKTWLEGISSEVTESGGFHPTFFSVWNWTNILMHEMKNESHIIFDGSPRVISEMPIVDDLWDFIGHKDTVYLFYIKLSDKEARERLRMRGRHDDHLEEYIENRISNFKKNSPAILDYYRKNPRYSFVEIDGDKSVEEVHNCILKAMGLRSEEKTQKNDQG